MKEEKFETRQDVEGSFCCIIGKYNQAKIAEPSPHQQHRFAIYLCQIGPHIVNPGTFSQKMHDVSPEAMFHANLCMRNMG